MYNHQLDTFIAVADAGSFNKASQLLYISPNAVMKQINLLETNLGFNLFERTHRGLVLTSAGKSFYNDTKYIINYSKEAISRAKEKSKNDHILKIGVSFTTPADFLVSLWSKIQQINPYLKFELISFENTPENAREIMRNFGRHIDMTAGIYSDNLLKERNCLAIHLYDTPICCAVPISHPLAIKDQLNIEDLFNEHVMIIKQNYLTDFDQVRVDLKTNYPSVYIEDIDFYNVNVFNQCVNENKLILAVKEWKNIHPMLKIVPIKWEHTIPFGIMYSPTPSKDMEQFILALKKLYK